MSILIDQLMRDTKNLPCYAKIGDKWFIAKPSFIKESLCFRLREAWKVLIGNHAFVYHYKRDEEN